MNPPTPRRCANWFQTYRDYILPRTDAPESFIFWSGIFTIASTLRRRVYVPKKYLGLWTCYPHMYLMFVGPPGMRKTTAIDHGAKELLSQIPALHQGPDFFTKEAVLEEMQNSGDNSIYMPAGEFSDIFQKSGKDRAGIYEFLTSMYDSKPQVSSRTKASGNVFLENPSINFFSATTPGWIAENMPESVISGGYASRCIWVYEDEPRIKKSLFDDVEGDFMQMEKNLLVDLMRISELQGEFQLTDETKRAINNFVERDPPTYIATNEKLGGYLNRKFMHTLKLAMYHSVACKDELVITLDDWQWAEETISTIEPNLEKVFKGVGKNPYVGIPEKIESYVRTMNLSTGRMITLAELHKQFESTATLAIFKEILDFMVTAKRLHTEHDGENMVFATPTLIDKMKTRLLR